MSREETAVHALSRLLRSDRSKVTLSGLLGKVTLVRFRRLSPDAKEALRLWKQVNELPEAVGLPKQWCFCHHCGAWGWRWPPHGLNDPCPIFAGAAESFGLKTDAERMTALRSGAHLEQASKLLQVFMQQSGLIPEEDDDDE